MTRSRHGRKEHHHVSDASARPGKQADALAALANLAMLRVMLGSASDTAARPDPRDPCNLVGQCSAGD